METRTSRHPLLVFRETHNPRLSQAAAATLVGISQPYWSQIEAGEKFCSPRVARRISDLTGVAVDYLLDWADDRANCAGAAMEGER